MDTERNDGLNALLQNARHDVPAHNAAQQFEHIMRRMVEPPILRRVSYGQLRSIAVAASVILLINVAAWLSSRNYAGQEPPQPSGLQSYNLNIY